MDIKTQQVLKEIGTVCFCYLKPKCVSIYIIQLFLKLSGCFQGFYLEVWSLNYRFERLNNYVFEYDLFIHFYDINSH